MQFKKVVFDSAMTGDIARVNRETQVLYINPAIWNRLTSHEREYVLFHEDGHLVLATADEFKANAYAIEKYCPVKTLTNSELGKRIQVMSEITDPARYISPLALDPVSAISGAVDSIFQALPMFGIGSKSRIKEQNAAAEAQLKLINAQSKSAAANQKLYLMVGIIAIVGIIMYFTLRK